MSDVLKFDNRPLNTHVVVQLFTVAKVNRSRTPRKCSPKGLYHVWIYKSREVEVTRPPKGTACKCGLMDW